MKKFHVSESSNILYWLQASSRSRYVANLRVLKDDKMFDVSAINIARDILNYYIKLVFLSYLDSSNFW